MRFASITALIAIVALQAGCAMVQVNSLTPGEYIAMRRGDILTTGELSDSSLQALRVVGLDAKPCKQAPDACFATLRSTAGLSDERRLATLSELWLQVAMNQAPDGLAPDSDEALEAYMEVARHAYAYMFFTASTATQRAFEDRQTQVRDYYNYAVQQAAIGMFKRYRLQVAQAQAEPLRIGKWTVSSDFSTVRLPAAHPIPRELIPASSLSFAGLRSTYRRDGLGAELVAVFDQDPVRDTITSTAPVDDGDGTAASRTAASPTASRPSYSEMPSPAVTTLLRFEGSTLQAVLATSRVQVAAYDPYVQASIDQGGQDIPLAGNFTAGYGLWLARSGFATQALRTLLGRADGIDTPHVYLMQPYDPRRRIILMLHGLASSPEAWVNVANEVLGDETLRERYQVWQVYYPTNVPIAVNHAAVRAAVTQTLQHFDPAGSAPASRDMVVVGHSMGGILARLMVSSAQDQLRAWIGNIDWRTNIRAQPYRKQLDAMLAFEPMPQVSEAIFIATPHRGTPFAGNYISRFIAGFVTLPVTLLKSFDELARELAKDGTPSPFANDGHLPNSVENLKDTDPFIRAASTLQIAPKVQYHSIIAKLQPERPLNESDDGVVPYTSAHLAGAASEAVITSAHSVQETPQAALEIRRILREALGVRGTPAAR